MAIYMLKIRRPLGRLIFNMGIAIPGKTVFLIETAPWLQQNANRGIILEIYSVSLCVDSNTTSRLQNAGPNKIHNQLISIPWLMIPVSPGHS